MVITALLIVILNLHFANCAASKDTILTKESTCSALISGENTVDVFEYFAGKYGTNNTLTVAQFLNVIDAQVFNVSSVASNDFSCQSQLNSSLFFTICPVLVKYLDIYKIKHDNARNISSDMLVSKPLSNGAVWGYGLLAVTIISICSLVGISVLPLMKSAAYNKILLYLITLAVGTLSSNAIFQLIPEGFGIDRDPKTVWRSAVIFGGFYIFYLMENILERIFNTSHSHVNEGKDCEGPVESQKSVDPNWEDETSSRDTDSYKKSIIIMDYSQETLLTTTENVCKISSTVSGQSSTDKLSRKRKNLFFKKWWIFKNYKTIKTVAWMITIADGIHNLIDGLAIGASFSTSMVQGVSTSLAIFCEEFPHELGDFAILLSSGMSIRQAAFYNFASACCCYVGLVIGIVLGHNFSAAEWIFALAGGVFLYISLAGMLPEAQAQSASKELRNSPWVCLILKHAGLLSGFFIMFFLTLYKDKIVV